MGVEPKVYKDGEYLTEEFDSLTQMYEYIKAHEKDKEWEYAQGGDSFSGSSKSWDEIKQMLLYGDQQLTDFYLKELPLPEYDTDSSSGVRMSIEGCGYDMGAVISGEPECCISMDSPSTKECIDMYVDIGYCGGVGASTIARRGVSIVKLITQLVSQGVIVNFHLAHYINTAGKKLATVMTLPTDTLSISNIAFICSPTFFRTISWLLNEIRTGYVGAGGDGCSKIDRDKIKDIEQSGGFYIPGGYIDYGWKNVKTQEQSDKKLLKLYEEWVQKQKGLKEVA